MITNELNQTAAFQVSNYIILLALALVIILFINRQKIKYYGLNIKRRYCLNQLGIKQLSDVRWPDGLGGYFFIDRLILRPDGITLFLHKPFQGKIFCADNIDEWTQMFGQKSYQFKNPLYDLDFQVLAVKKTLKAMGDSADSSFVEAGNNLNTSEVPVDGFLLFDDTAEFPKGHPDRVISYNAIPENLKCDKNIDVSRSVSVAWDTLTALSAKA